MPDDKTINTAADAAAAGFQVHPGTIPPPEGNAPVEQTMIPATGQPEDLTQPAQVAPVRPGVRDQGLRPPARPGVIGKLEDTAQFTAPHVLGEIFQTLAGGKKKYWEQTDQGPVAKYRDLAPGEMARGILAAAITGLASGYDPARRGKGPAMASAFHAGFEGNQERTDIQKKQESDEAQKQFQNKGVAEDRKLRMAEFAQRQQESIDRHTEHVTMMKKIDQEVKNAEETHLNEVTRFNHERQQWWDSYMNQGATVPAGFPKDGFQTEQELLDWAHQNPDVAVGTPKAGGHFNTVFAMKPGSSRHFILQIPVDEAQIPHWHGVLHDKNDEPIRDAQGNLQADPKEPYYGPDGRTPIIPAGKVTDEQFYKHNQSIIDARARFMASEADLEKARAAAEKAAQDRKNDKDLQAARKHYTDAINKGSIDATDDRGNLIFTAGDRDAMKVAARNAHSEHYKAWSDGNKELDQMDPNDPRREETQKIVDQEKELLTQAASLDLAMIDPPTAATAITKNMLKEKTYRDEDGKVNIAKVEAALSPELAKPVHDQIIANMNEANKALAAPKPTTKLRDVPKPNKAGEAVTGAITGALAGGPGGAVAGATVGYAGGIDEPTRQAINKLQTVKERVDYINKLPLSDDGKKQLISSATVSAAAPTKVIYMVDPDGNVRPVLEKNQQAALDAGGTMANQQQIDAFLGSKGRK